MSLPASGWLNPPHVMAPDPEDHAKLITLEISRTWIETLFFNRRRSPIFQVWAHVVGKLPPINNISRLAEASLSPSLITLSDSISCFRGVRRPHGSEEQGRSVIVYVLRPEVTIAYEPSMLCVATAFRVPVNTLLTIHVCPADSLQDSALSIKGNVTRLEFVSGDERDARRPMDWFERYDSCLW